MLKRAVDILLSGAALAVLGLPLLALMVAVRLGSPGPALHWSERVGRDNRLFAMPKLRTMRQGAPQLATHLFADADAWATPLGRRLRDASLDELPQLLSVLKGDMSLVGPRPALFNQDDLIALRIAAGVHRLRPGLTGWAQVNGRDELSVEEKVRFDADYLRRRSLLLDMQIMLATAIQLLPRRLRPPLRLS